MGKKRNETGADSGGVATETGAAALAETEAAFFNQPKEGDGGEAAARIDEASPVPEFLRETFSEESPEAPVIPAETSAPAVEGKKPYNGKKRGPKPGSKRRRVPSGPSPLPKVKTAHAWRSNAEMAEEIKRLEATISQMGAGKELTFEAEEELKMQIEGAILTAQMIGSQVIGKFAVLEKEQSEKLVRVWIAPFRRLVLWINDGEGTTLPGWLSTSITLLLASLSTAAILFPNWQAYVDSLPMGEDGKPDFGKSPEKSGLSMVVMRPRSVADIEGERPSEPVP